MAALEVLNFVEGMWHARGPSSAPVLLLTDKQFNALVAAGVVSADGKEGEEVKARGKKATGKKNKS